MATMEDYLREMQLRAARGWTPGVPTRYTGALSTSYAPFSNLGALYSAAQPKLNLGDIAAASNPVVEKKPTVGRPRLTPEQIQRTASRLGQGTVKALPAVGAAYELLRSEPAVASELAPGINPTDFRVTQAYPSMAVDDPTTPVVETYPNVSTLPGFDISPDAGGALGGVPGVQPMEKYGPSGYEGERIPPTGFRQIAPDTVIASQPNWDTMENMYAQLGGAFPADTEVQGFWDRVAQGNIINELTKSAGAFNEGSVASKALEPFFGDLPEYRTRSDAIEKMANMGLVSGLEADAWKGWDLGKSLQEDAIGQVVGAAVTAGTATPYQIGDELFGHPADSGRNIGLQTPVVDALSQGWEGAKSGLANVKGLVQAYTNPDVMPVERLSAFADMLQQGTISPEYAIDQTPEMMRLDKYGVEEFSDFEVQENLRKAEELATPVVAPAPVVTPAVTETADIAAMVREVEHRNAIRDQVTRDLMETRDRGTPSHAEVQAAINAMMGNEFGGLLALAGAEGGGAAGAMGGYRGDPVGREAAIVGRDR